MRKSYSLQLHVHDERGGSMRISAVPVVCCGNIGEKDIIELANAYISKAKELANIAKTSLFVEPDGSLDTCIKEN